MEDYMEQFMSGEDGAPRAAVKRLTAAIERELTQSTINAPDWLVNYPVRFAHVSPQFCLIAGILSMLLGWHGTFCGQENVLSTLMNS